MQFDERANQRKSKSWSAVLGASGVRFEPVEHAILGLRRNAWTVIGHAEHDRIYTPLREQDDGFGRRREADRI